MSMDIVKKWHSHHKDRFLLYYIMSSPSVKALPPPKVNTLEHCFVTKIYPLMQLDRNFSNKVTTPKSLISNPLLLSQHL